MSAKWAAPTNMNSTQAMLIGAVHDLEERRLLDEQVVCTVKTLILEENREVIKLLNSYIAHILEERELCTMLQKLSERMSTCIERPTSPLPRKISLLEFVNNMLSSYIRDRDDLALLHRLIEDENEFVLSAFDVFESDGDQENLLDTLLRIVAKCKRMGISRNSVPATGFYNGDILTQQQPQPRPQQRPDTRGQERPTGSKTKQRRTQPPPAQSSESDSNGPAEFHFHGEEDAEPSAAARGPASSRRPQSRPHPKPPVQQVQTEEEDQPQAGFKDFEDTGALQDLDDDVVGTLRWAVNNKERTVLGAIETYKLTTDARLLHDTIKTVCGHMLEKSLTDNMGVEGVNRYCEQSNGRNPQVLRAAKEFRASGNLPDFLAEVRRLGAVKAREKKEPAPEEEPETITKSQHTPEESEGDEETEREIAGEILNLLETEGRISKEDVPKLAEMYVHQNREVVEAIKEFKRDHDLELLGNKLTPLVKRRHVDEVGTRKQGKAKKKKKYKTFEECIEFFKVTTGELIA